MSWDAATHSIADPRWVSKGNSYCHHCKLRGVFSAAMRGITGYTSMANQKLRSIQCWICGFTGGVDIDHLADEKYRVAEKSGVGLGTIKDMESGKSFPRWETRQKLRRALGMPEERYCSMEERNALFLAFYEKGYIEMVINQNRAYLYANNAGIRHQLCH